MVSLLHRATINKNEAEAEAKYSPQDQSSLETLTSPFISESTCHLQLNNALKWANSDMLTVGDMTFCLR